jgi:hypothetical protein
LISSSVSNHHVFADYRSGRVVPLFDMLPRFN